MLKFFDTGANLLNYTYILLLTIPFYTYANSTKNVAV